MDNQTAGVDLDDLMTYPSPHGTLVRLADVKCRIASADQAVMSRATAHNLTDAEIDSITRNFKQADHYESIRACVAFATQRLEQRLDQVLRDVNGPTHFGEPVLARRAEPSVAAGDERALFTKWFDGTMYREDSREAMLTGWQARASLASPAVSQNAAPKIKTWQERVMSGYELCDEQEARNAEVAELRAALAQQSSSQAPLDKEVEKQKFIAWGQIFHRNARSYTARDFDHGFLAWLAAKSDVAVAQQGASHAANAGEIADGARWRFMMAAADDENSPEAKAMELFARCADDDDSRPESVKMTEIVDKARAAIASSAAQEGK